MKNLNLKVGDKVRIREWDDMVDEYRVDKRDNILTESGLCFVSTMKPYCGKIVTVRQIGHKFGYFLIEDDYSNWDFDTYMVSEVIKKEPLKLKAGDKVRIKKWDTMVKEYMIDDNGDIEIERGSAGNDTYFTKRERRFCGLVLEIERIDDDGSFLIEDEQSAAYLAKECVAEIIKEEGTKHDQEIDKKIEKLETKIEVMRIQMDYLYKELQDKKCKHGGGIALGFGDCYDCRNKREECKHENTVRSLIGSIICYNCAKILCP